MKEENEVVLEEMSKMRDTVQSAQDKCAAVQSLIKQFKKNSLNSLNPNALLKEVCVVVVIVVVRVVGDASSRCSSQHCRRQFHRRQLS